MSDANWQREYRKRKFEKHLLNVAKRSAKVKNLPFDLVEADIVIPKYCPYLGLELTKESRRDHSLASLDRKIPALGYVKGNVEVISWLANKMKQNATQEELITFAKAILKMENK